MTGATGEWRRVRRVVPLAADLVLRDRARRAVERVAGARGATLARCSEVQVVPEGLAVVHDEPLGSRPLVQDTGSDPVVGLRVLADAAAGLAALHDAGIAHGGVAAELLLVTAEGRGVLSGAGLAAAMGRGDPSPADDVRALADLALEVLPPRGVPAAAVHALVRATDPDAGVRPTAADLAQTLGTAARRALADPPTGPVPVIVPGAAPPAPASPGEASSPEAMTSPGEVDEAARPGDEDRSEVAGPAGAFGAPGSPPARRRGVVGPDPVRWQPAVASAAAGDPPAPGRAAGAAPPAARAPRGVRSRPRRERRRTGAVRVVAPLAVAASLVLGAGALRAVGGTIEPDPAGPADPAGRVAVASPPTGLDATVLTAPGTGDAGLPDGAGADAAASGAAASDAAATVAEPEPEPEPVPEPGAAGVVTGGSADPAFPAAPSTGAAGPAPTEPASTKPGGPSSGAPAAKPASPAASAATRAASAGPSAGQGGAAGPDRGAGDVPPPAPDWQAVVAGLDAARAAAYADPGAAALDGFDVPGSPAWQRDAAALADLRSRGEAAIGLVTELVGVRLVSRKGDRATLQVTDRRSAYTLVGATTRAQPAAPQRRWTVVLQRTPEGWRYRSAQLR